MRRTSTRTAPAEPEPNGAQQASAGEAGSEKPAEGATKGRSGWWQRTFG